MTIPPLTPHDSLLDTPAAQAEWQTMLRMRDESMNQMLARLGITATANDALGQMQNQLDTSLPGQLGWLDQQNAQNTHDYLTNANPLDKVPAGLVDRAVQGMHSLFGDANQNRNADLTSTEHSDLVDRAKYWGIPGADAMPTQMLQAAVAARRDDAVRPTDIGMMGWLQGSANLIGTSAMEKVGAMTKDIPFIGETMNKMVHSQAAGLWVDAMKMATGIDFSPLQTDPSAMRVANERALAGLPQTLPTDLVNVAGKPVATDFVNNVGYGIGYAPGAIASWEALGALRGIGIAGRYAGSLTPMARIALGAAENATQGGLATWLQNGGSADFGAKDLVAGGLGGAALGLVGEMGPALEKLWGKATDAFGTPITDFIPNDVPRQTGWADVVGDAQLGPGPKYLGPSGGAEASGPSPVRAYGDVAQGTDMLGTSLVRTEAGSGGDFPVVRGVSAPSGSDVGAVSATGDGGAGTGIIGPDGVPQSAPSPVRALAQGPIGENGQALYEPMFGQRPFRAPAKISDQAIFLAGSHVADEFGNAMPVVHGTTKGFGQFTLDNADPNALWGKGGYFTESPTIAGGTPALIDEAAASKLVSAPPLGYAGSRPLGSSPDYAPQVHKVYLDIKKPLRLDAMVDLKDAHALIDEYGDANGVDVKAAHNWVSNRLNGPYGGGAGYLDYADVHIGLQNNLQGLPENAGMATEDALNAVNDGFKKLGYDGLTHIGGQITGNDPHRVWIAWDGTQVHPMFAPTLAAEDAINLSKQSTIMSSPLAAEHANQAVLSNLDVAKAAVASRSGGINVIAGIGNLGQTVQDLAVNAGAHPLQYRFAFHPSGRIDMLASDAHIPQDAVDEYSKHGLFVGQEVSTATGKGGRVTKLTDDKVTVQSPFAKRGYAYNHSDIYPRGGSYAYVDSPEAYTAFRDFADKYIGAESGKAGLMTTSSLDPQYNSMLNDVMHTWLAHMGYDNATAAGLEQYFNVRRMEDFRALAPEEVKFAEDIQHEADATEAARMESHPPDIQQRAEANGFSWVSSPNTAGGQLWDRNSSLKFAMESEGEADQFMKNYVREHPDHTPMGDVPLEIFPHIAQGSSLPPTGEVSDVFSALDNPLGAPHVWDGITEDAHDIPEEPVMGVGGYNPPPSPPSGPPSYATSPGEPPGFYGPARLGPQTSFDYAFRDVSPRDLNDLMTKYNGFLTRAILPARASLQRMSSSLYDMGVAQHGVDPWGRYEEVERGMKNLETFMKPHMQETNKIFAGVRNKFLRDGTFSKVHEIQNWGERDRAMTAAGFSPAEREASDAFRNWTDKMWNVGKDLGVWSQGRDFIPQYMSHVRMRSGMPGVVDPWTDVNNDLPRGFEFFADNMRYGGLEIRQMDPRWLAQHYLRAMGWKAYVDAPMQDFMQLANALGGNGRGSDGLAPVIGQYMQNWAQVAQRGYSIEGDMAVQGLKGMLNMVPGVHLSTQQTAHIMNKGLTLMHWGLLGFRPHVLFRDAIQPLLAGMKSSYTVLGGVYGDFLAPGGAMREEMTKRAIEGGWAEINRSPVEMPGMFDQMPMTPSGDNLLNEKEQYVHQMLAGIGDMVRDATPKSLRTIAGSKLDPLHYYQKEGSFNRVMAGETGYRVAKAASDRLNAYNLTLAGLATPAQKALIGDLVGANGIVKPYTKAMYLAESSLDTFQRAVGEKAWGLASSGQFQEANFLAGREMANETQFQYGTRNLAPAMKSLSGRMVMQFGSFSTNFASMLGNGLSKGAASSRVKLAAGVAALTAGASVASNKTGWNFNNYMWLKGFGFSGGPLVQAFATTLPAWSALVNTMTGGESKSDARNANVAMRGIGNLPGAIALNTINMFNPLSGLIQEGQMVSHALDQPRPLYEITGEMLTGPRAAGSSYRIQENNFIDNAGQWSLPTGRPGGIPPELEQHFPPITPAGGGAIQ